MVERTTNKITKLLILYVALVGAIALAILIIGVATTNWITVSSSSSSLETKLNDILLNTSFISSLIIATGTNQTQVLTIISATVSIVKEQLSNGIGQATYHLFDKTPNLLKTPPNFKLSQVLILTGMVSIFIGVLLAVIICLLNLQRVIRTIPLLFLVIGPILITIGYIFYTKLVIEDFGVVFQTSVAIGYSFILIIISSIIGYITAVFFAFTILHPRRQKKSTHHCSVDIKKTTIVKEQKPVIISTSF
ncbi:hypothetical protein I4U23_003571 [Adineta vaga]|nr:hypothetical protein I4U23_003571 [Adineta vaga]